MEWYYDGNKLEQFYNLYKKYYADIANKFWTSLDPEDYDGCYMSTAIDIGNQTMSILKYSFLHNMNPNDEYDRRQKVDDRRQKLELISEKLESINEDFATTTITWKSKLFRSIREYEEQEEEIFTCIFEHYCVEKEKN